MGDLDRAASEKEYKQVLSHGWIAARHARPGGFGGFCMDAMQNRHRKDVCAGYGR
ncbi:MAG: hypothetical protein IMF05_04355 [Proteobacteria bacterium]|nr:hypothetical protein [Pseudomonadota bacterium]